MQFKSFVFAAIAFQAISFALVIPEPIPPKAALLKGPVIKAPFNIPRFAGYETDPGSKSIAPSPSSSGPLKFKEDGSPFGVPRAAADEPAEPTSVYVPEIRVFGNPRRAGYEIDPGSDVPSETSDDGGVGSTEDGGVFTNPRGYEADPF